MYIIENLNKIEKIDERLNDALDYFKRYLNTESKQYKNLINQSDGFINKIDVSESLFFIEQVYSMRERVKCQYESHLKYIDLHFILSGSEIIEVENISYLEIDTPYNEIKDATKYSNVHLGTQITLNEFELIVLEPNDGHMTAIEQSKDTSVVKIVAKILI